MKLGVLGVFRFGSQIACDYLLSHEYLFLLMSFRVCVFLFSCQELDGKR